MLATSLPCWAHWDLKMWSPISLAKAKQKAWQSRNVNHILNWLPSHCISLHYEQLEVFLLVKLQIPMAVFPHSSYDVIVDG